MKGRLLVSPRGLNIRPTTDRIREAIFSIIGQNLSGVKVLDLFAGTGSLGLEALSRDALHSVFIDNSQQSVNLIKKNLALFGYQDRAAILRRDLKKGIPRNHPLLTESFDLVFLDPPYGKNFVTVLLEMLSTTDLVSSRSRVVAESSKDDNPPVSFGNLKKVDTRLYGGTNINIYACD